MRENWLNMRYRLSGRSGGRLRLRKGKRDTGHRKFTERSMKEPAYKFKSNRRQAVVSKRRKKDD